MKRKCIIGIIISLNLIILNVCSAFATSPTEVTSAISAVIATLNAAEEGSARQQAVSEWIHKQSGALGFLFDLSSGSLPPATLKYLLPDPSQYENATDNEIVNACRDLILNHQTVVNNEIVLDTTLNNCIKNFVDSYVEDNKISIWYCCSVQASSSSDLVNGFLEDAVPIMDEYKNNAYYLLRTSNNGTTYFYVIPKSDCKIYGVQSAVFSSEWHGFNLYRCKDISGVITYEPILVRDSLCTVYLYGSDGHLTLINDHSTIDQGYAESPLGAYYYYQAGHGTEGHDFLRYPKGISKYGDTIETFLSTSALDTYIHSTGVGLQPYYYNNSVWSNFVDNSSGDYTVSTNNVNTVTYGDTVTYIQDSYNQTGNYPDNSTVNNWIETTNNNNNSGGGSGGGSGGSGDDSGGSGIVSILTALGKAIADLITGIAAFLAEVVGGLVESITGLLDTLTDLITNFTESIPNIFSPLLGWLFDGLPEEFIAIILLGLTACVIASIIKILRG